MCERLISNSFIMLNENEEHILEYYLIKESDINYGIRIMEYVNSKIINNEQCMVSKSRHEVVDLIRIIAKNFVFPSTLQDIVADKLEIGWVV
jgi:hypothetical protein